MLAFGALLLLNVSDARRRSLKQDTREHEPRHISEYASIVCTTFKLRAKRFEAKTVARETR